MGTDELAVTTEQVITPVTEMWCANCPAEHPVNEASAVATAAVPAVDAVLAKAAVPAVDAVFVKLAVPAKAAVPAVEAVSAEAAMPAVAAVPADAAVSADAAIPAVAAVVAKDAVPAVNAAVAAATVELRSANCIHRFALQYLARETAISVRMSPVLQVSGSVLGFSRRLSPTRL